MRTPGAACSRRLWLSMTDCVLPASVVCRLERTAAAAAAGAAPSFAPAPVHRPCASLSLRFACCSCCCSLSLSLSLAGSRAAAYLSSLALSLPSLRRRMPFCHLASLSPSPSRGLTLGRRLTHSLRPQGHTCPLT